jgi:hypothetical protein
MMHSGRAEIIEHQVVEREPRIPRKQGDGDTASHNHGCSENGAVKEEQAGAKRQAGPHAEAVLGIPERSGGTGWTVDKR